MEKQSVQFLQKIVKDTGETDGTGDEVFVGWLLESGIGNERRIKKKSTKITPRTCGHDS